METKIKPIFNIRQEIIYADEANQRHYRRLIGGLAWPALPKPGFLVVLAEEVVTGPIPDTPPRLWVVAEREATSIKDMYRYCLELRYSWKTEIKWLTDVSPGRKPEKDAFRNAGREFPQAPNPISLHAALYSDTSPTLGTYSQIIADLIRPECKILHFLEGSSLQGYLLTCTPEESERHAANFPPVAALGYAAAEMAVRQPPSQIGIIWPGTKKPNVKKDWNPYQNQGPPYGPRWRR
ncbi:MAG: hypothetical protein ABSA04_07695 [Desulfobaccales bacterium]|jgi:hypothetical protein